MIKFSNYSEYKNALDAEMQTAVEGFVAIGYLLELAEQTNILEESGYANVNDFAKAEYNIDKTQVSRFINIYRRFGEQGNPCLREEYRGYGVAKLGLMLTLPDAVNEELSPEYSKAEIQTIKEEVDEEKKITDLEVLMEGEQPQQQAMNNLKKTVHQLGMDRPELYAALHKTMQESGRAAEPVQETLAPLGEVMYTVRLQGIGRLMLVIRDTGRDLTLTNIRTGEKESYSWAELLNAIGVLMADGVKPEESWEAVYGRPFPKKEEIAPVQPETGKAEQKKTESRRQSKVERVKPAPRKEPAPVHPKEPGSESGKDENMMQAPAGETEQFPGQMEVTDYPELLTEEMQRAEEQQEKDPETAEGEDVPAEELEICDSEPDVHEMYEMALETAYRIEHTLGAYRNGELPEEITGQCLTEARNLWSLMRLLHEAAQERSKP